MARNRPRRDAGAGRCRSRPRPPRGPEHRGLRLSGHGRLAPRSPGQPGLSRLEERARRAPAEPALGDDRDPPGRFEERREHELRSRRPRPRARADAPDARRRPCVGGAARRGLRLVPEPLRPRERRDRPRTGLRRLRIRRLRRRHPREDVDADPRRAERPVHARGGDRRHAGGRGRGRDQHPRRARRVLALPLPAEPERLRVARGNAGQLRRPRPRLRRARPRAGGQGPALGGLSARRGPRHGQAPGRPPDDADVLPLRGLLPLHARPRRSRRHRLLVARAARVLRRLRHRHEPAARAERDDDAPELHLRRRRERLLREAPRPALARNRGAPGGRRRERADRARRPSTSSRASTRPGTRRRPRPRSPSRTRAGPTGERSPRATSLSRATG